MFKQFALLGLSKCELNTIKHSRVINNTDYKIFKSQLQCDILIATAQNRCTMFGGLYLYISIEVKHLVVQGLLQVLLC